ncbi:MAG: hypothetical protein DWQ04_03530 [Chloroflexi bacterium]|nr:MAG: hypothetical protein DWQ04_03530 [Chloroflexota bacterium]
MFHKKIGVALLFAVSISSFIAIFIFYSLASTSSLGAWNPRTSIVFYDGALGGTPNEQDMAYETEGIPFSQVTQTFSNGATTLDSTANILDYAGYGITTTLVPTLEPIMGFQLNFTAQVISETHDVDNRAGFSVILLGEDLQGIELAFWEGKISAQEGGTTNLFSFAESVNFDATAELTDYTLEIIGGRYVLRAEGVYLLDGPVRDYTAWVPPVGAPADPYEQPNFVFLGDNSSQGKSRIRLSYVELMIGTFGPLTITSSPTPTLTPTPAFKLTLPMIIRE